MDYWRIYNQIVAKRKVDVPIGYTENHHILPDCLGGLYTEDNMVRLTAKEHFICHLLLTKMYERGSQEYYKMIHAFHAMSVMRSDNQDRYVSSRKYEYLRAEHAQAMSVFMTGRVSDFTWCYNLDLKESKMFKKDGVPTGWVAGGKLPKYLIRKCSNCEHIGTMTSRSKFCSEECRTIVKKEYNSNRPPILFENTKVGSKENEFVKVYKTCGSIMKTLRLVGLADGGANYDAANAWIIKYNLQDIPLEKQIVSDETRQKISDANKRTNASRAIKVSLALTNNPKTKKSEECKKQIGERNRRKRKVNDGVVNKTVDVDELDMFLSLGWKRGLLIKGKNC